MEDNKEFETSNNEDSIVEEMACNDEKKLEETTTEDEEIITAEQIEEEPKECSETPCEDIAELSSEKDEEIIDGEETIEECAEEDKADETVNDDKSEEVSQLSFMELIDSELIEEHKEFAESIKDLDYSELFTKFAEMNKINDELIKEHDEIEREKALKTFEQIMSEVKADLTEEKFAELYNEGKELPMDALNGFKNKVKAFAYDEAKVSKKVDATTNDDIIIGIANNNKKNYDESDVFSRLANK